MKNKQLFFFGSSCTFFFFFTGLPAKKAQNVKNHPPKVTIIIPKNNSGFEWDSYVRYSISVTDQEDGKSEYQEILASEVFLEVIYFSDFKIAEKNLLHKMGTNQDSPGLAIIKSSNCFNCHAVKTKLIGPSYLEISKRYPHNPVEVESLGKKVINGSSGIWTNTAMPPHPDLTTEKSRLAIQWIFKKAEDPNLNYFPGTEGSFRTRVKPPHNAKGSYLITASYTDHGLKDLKHLRLRGQHAIVLRSN